MASKMTVFCLFVLSMICVSSDDDLDSMESASIELNPMELNPINYPPMVCYTSQLKIGKQTLATTDSYRDTEMIQLIFPEAKLEYIPHFNQDLCARASKVFLPYTCFKLHAPQTWEFEEGYLSIATLEKEYTMKFYAVINGHSKYNYDAFLDNNMAFWVLNLDKYFQQINDNHHILTSYIGLKWHHETIGKTFYSLIIQSPGSQRIIELISFNKPDLSIYPNIRENFKWKKTNMIRASFKQYPEGEYPWTGYIGTIYKKGMPVLPDIVPIRISYACSDIKKQIAFYNNIMEATLLDWDSIGFIDTLDSIVVKYAFLKPKGDSLIEIQYVERPMDYTYGDFTVETYKNLLLDTHNDRISGIYCGIDRWFDNHYGYDSSKFKEEDPNYMDRVISSLDEMGLKYRLYYIDHQRDDDYVHFDSDSFDIDEVENLSDLEYKLFVLDANGQAIQLIGYLINTYIPENPPIYNKQWCATKCPNNKLMGVFDWKKQVYVEDIMDTVYQAIYGNTSNNTALPNISNESDHPMFAKFSAEMLIIIISAAVMLISSVLYCVYVCYNKANINDNAHNHYNPETQYLLHNKK